jgi:site-specific DNA-cytosine methylase
MRTIELFSGTKSFSKVAKKFGYETFTIDNNEELNPDLRRNVEDLVAGDITHKDGIDIIWASPPCTAFSVASIGHHWKGGKCAYIPKTEFAKQSQKIVKKTIKLIKDIKPKYWFIENPRGVLRKMPFMKDFHRVTVSYCQYGDTRMKPTDIWTNFTDWKPKSISKNGDKCHISAPRGSRTGTQGLKNAKERGVIPPALFEEIFKQISLPQPLK